MKFMAHFTIPYRRMVTAEVLPVSRFHEDFIRDRLIWIAFREGDPDAFGELYFLYFNVLFYHGYSACSDGEIIKDCIHDLFTALWKNKGGLALPESVKAYLLRSLRRRLLKCLVKGRRQRWKSGSEITEMIRSVEEKLITEQSIAQQQHRIIGAMPALSKRQREAFVLKFYAELSYPVMANKMKISVYAVYNLITKAISNLQRELCIEKI